MKIVWNTLAIDIEFVPILKHPTSLLSSCPPPPFPFIHEFHLAPQAEMGGGGTEKRKQGSILAGISHHVASSLQAKNSAA